MSQRARSARGQAVVETALASFVIVTVVLFGIHFAEVGYIALKVHEAAAFAAFDGTQRPMHRLPGTTFGGVAGAAAGAANGRYADFDSRAGSGAGTFTQVVTRGVGMQVNCNMTGAIRGPPPPGVAGGVLPDTGGMACRSSAAVLAFRIPDRFLEGSRGLSEAEHLHRSSYSACGMGRPRPGGSCQGRVGILLGDWALSLPGEQALTPGNGDYDASARQIWSNNGGKQGNAAETLAVDFAGWAPYHLPFVIQNNTDHTYTESISGSGSFLP